jgi:hypothetical protein
MATYAEQNHPSVFINEELAERGWSLRDMVFRMRRFDSENDWGRELLAMEMYMAVHDPRIILDQQQADGLGTAFDVSPQFFLNLHDSWRKWKTEPSGDGAEAGAEPDATSVTASEKPNESLGTEIGGA